MIKNTKQNWSIGKQVRVGFLTLTVLEIIPTPGDSKPDKYLLANSKGKKYTFTPYYGLEEI